MSLKRWSYFLEMVSLVAEPEVLPDVQGVLEAAAGEALDGGIQVVHALRHARAVELVHQLARLGAVGRGVDQLHLAGAGNAHLRVLVHVAVGVTGDGDGLVPVAARTARCPATMMGARNTVPSRMARMVPLGLFHISFRSYSSTRAALGVMVAHFTATPSALGGLGGIHGHLVVGRVAMLEAQVVVLGLEVDVRAESARP